ncbi:MAG: TetR/AcrR family transcriptional regulator [Actinomycetota bacterium]|nr:TetR/AcrR family transcriptional regulator [Actinomycetota bacterium]
MEQHHHISRFAVGVLTEFAVGECRAVRDPQARLIAVAREQFGERGYEGTSISAVLDGAGVAKGALYHHFESKVALFDAVLDQVVAEIATAARDAARAESDPLAQLRAGCIAWLELALDPAVQRIALVDSPGVVGWARWRALDEEHVLRGMRASIERLAAEGRVQREHVVLFAHMVLAAVNEAALMIAGADDPEAAFAEGTRAVEVMLTRLATAP